MKPIGGYFELELSCDIDNMPHKDEVLLNSGRNALEYILRCINKVKKIYVPYYTCDAVLQPLERLKVPFQYYHVDDNLRIADDIPIGDDEYLIYTNYYGVMDAYVFELSKKYGKKLIIDDAQALYAPSIDGCWQIFSPRKFVGVPDGGIAVTNGVECIADLPYDESYDRCSHLLKRHDLVPSEGYLDFKQNSLKLSQTSLASMSLLTRAMLKSIDFNNVKKRRNDNFRIIHNAMEMTNEFRIPGMDTFECPMVYPYRTSMRDLRKKLIENQIFVATYWPNVLEWCKEADVEYQLTSNTVCIPIDQRYNQEDMNRIIKIVQDR